MKRIFFFTGCFLLILVPILHAQQCDQESSAASKMLLKTAQDKDNFSEKENIIQNALSLCPSFDTNYALANTLFEHASAIESDELALKATQFFKDAFCTACSEKERGLALAGLGQTAITQNQWHKAVYYLKLSIERKKDSNIEALLHRYEEKIVQTGSSADDIAETLSVDLACTNQPHCTKSKGALLIRPIEKPSLNLHIHFQYNSDKLDETGKLEAQKLAQALSRKNFENKSIALIGHTDSRGSRTYNEELSLRRANAVRDFLVFQEEINNTYIRTEGHGEEEPLRKGHTEEDYSLNRRVEVSIQ